MERVLRIVVLVALVLVSILSAFREHVAQARFAIFLRERTMEDRRRMLFGPWYAEVLDIGNRVPVSGTVDLVMQTPAARDIAVLAGPLFQPRDVRYYDGMQDFHARRRARFLHDEHASNAIPGPPPPEASITVLVDPSARPHFQVMP